MDHRDNVPADFHPLIRQWFCEELGAPSPVQSLTWPVIASGRHVLVTAPTGSGKTLAAFLFAIQQLITGAWGLGRTRVLYVSPQKALNNDIRRNLVRPLAELQSRFRDAGLPFADIGVLTRSGDTPAEERRQMLRRPPEILITTPESLNIIISSPNGRAMLTGIVTVILDEIHAVVGSKRGTHLITAVERLVPLCGEFQRIALSATVAPLSTVAAFVGGYRQRDESGEVRYEPRPVHIIKAPGHRRYGIVVRFPPDVRGESGDASFWPGLIAAFRDTIGQSRSTLLFANSRRMAEKVTRLLNEGEPEPFAYSHHGSLSREIRLAVEERLKRGEIKAIVATSSLELGIDIGELDQVILIQTPPSIASTIQRIGRSGHKVGGMSRGLIYPTHGHDFLTAAIVAKSAMDEDIEAVTPVACPLDVLAQVIVSMTSNEKWDIDRLFCTLRATYPYHRLSRKQFDLVLDMLAGRYAGTRLRELRPRISLDGIDRTVHGKEGVVRLLYLSGGTIPDRGYYDLRIQDSHARIGELDEEFVWERRVGDTFTLGAQAWRIRQITHNDVFVIPSAGGTGLFPFWRAEDQDRSWHFAEKILLFLESCQARCGDPAWEAGLRQDYGMEEGAAAELVRHLHMQREQTRADLPHRHHVLIEDCRDPGRSANERQIIVHTLWGGRINRPFSLALQAAWLEKYGRHLEAIHNNDCILLSLPDGFSASGIFALVTPDNLERLLRRTLETSGFFGAKFRENAGRALLLPRSNFKSRRPLWLTRLRAKELLDAVSAFPDFPILLETWRTCLQDEFDIEHLRLLLGELQNGQIRITETRTPIASPFAAGLIWKETNIHMYADDTPSSGRTSRLSQEVLQEVLFSSRLRPRIPPSLVETLESKLQRTAPGYAPRSAEDLLDWLKERYLIPWSEWQALLRAMDRDREIGADQVVSPIARKIVSLQLPEASARNICALENLSDIVRAFDVPAHELDMRGVGDGKPLKDKAARLLRTTLRPSGSGEPPEEPDRSISDILRQWLSYYGPVRRSTLTEILGLSGPLLDEVLTALIASEEAVLDLLRENAAEAEVCDRENLEILLRMARKARRPSFRALGIEQLPLFLAAYHGLTAGGKTVEDLQRRLEQLFGFPASAEAWEEYLLPARFPTYDPAWLDGLIQSTDLLWFGCGTRKISFALISDLELFLPPAGEETGNDPALQALARLFPQRIGRFSFSDIVRYANTDSRAVAKQLWNLAWRGFVTNDTFATLRQGILTAFAPLPVATESGRTPRRMVNRWSATRPWSGNWYALTRENGERDPLDEVELVKDRVRQLLRRYGIIFRELLAEEMPLFQWTGVFKALRIMELSGEVLSGHFFTGIPGLQFISPEAFRILQEPLPEDAIFWVNATDPVSICGVRLDALKGTLPSRIPSTQLVYGGKELVLVAHRNGRVLDFFVSPDDPRLPQYLACCKSLLTRAFNPGKFISIESINGQPALNSDYVRPLREFGFTIQHKGLEMRRPY